MVKIINFDSVSPDILTQGYSYLNELFEELRLRVPPEKRIDRYLGKEWEEVFRKERVDRASFLLLIQKAIVWEGFDEAYHQLFKFLTKEQIFRMKLYVRQHVSESHYQYLCQLGSGSIMNENSIINAFQKDTENFFDQLFMYPRQLESEVVCKEGSKILIKVGGFIVGKWKSRKRYIEATRNPIASLLIDPIKTLGNYYGFFLSGDDAEMVRLSQVTHPFLQGPVAVQCRDWYLYTLEKQSDDQERPLNHEKDCEEPTVFLSLLLAMEELLAQGIPCDFFHCQGIDPSFLLVQGPSFSYTKIIATMRVSSRHISHDVWKYFIGFRVNQVKKNMTDKKGLLKHFNSLSSLVKHNPKEGLLLSSLHTAFQQLIVWEGFDSIYGQLVEVLPQEQIDRLTQARRTNRINETIKQSLSNQSQRKGVNQVENSANSVTQEKEQESSRVYLLRSRPSYQYLSEINYRKGLKDRVQNEYQTLLPTQRLHHIQTNLIQSSS